MRTSIIVAAAAALPVILDIAFGITGLRQCRKPWGPAGGLVVKRMNRSHAALTRWALSHVTIAPHATMLDVGCGGGQTIHTLAELAPLGTVHGVDYSRTSVDTSRSLNAALIAEKRVDIQLASVSKLPFAGATFDLVTAIETHYYWPDLEHDSREVRRVLAPGGRLLLVAEAYDRPGAPGAQRRVMAALKAKYLTRDAHRTLVESAGFADVQTFEDEAKGWLCVVATNPRSGQE